MPTRDASLFSTMLSERLSRLEAARDERIDRDLAVILMQLARAEDKLTRGNRDVRRELRVIEQRLVRAEKRLRSPVAFTS